MKIKPGYAIIIAVVLLCACIWAFKSFTLKVGQRYSGPLIIVIPNSWNGNGPKDVWQLEVENDTIRSIQKL